MKKKYIFCILIIALVTILIIISFVMLKKIDNNTGFNDKLLLADRKIDNSFEVKNIEIKYHKKEDYYLLTFEANNLTENRIKGDEYLILFKDKNNNILFQEDGSIMGDIDSQGNIFLKLYIHDDISNMENIDIVKK